jgi:hypothetical protein
MAATLSKTAEDIITSALRSAGIIRPDQVIQARDLATGLEVYNTLIKRWQTQGDHLWARDEGVLFLDNAKESYSIGPSGDEATTASDFVSTTTSAALAALDTTVTVASTTGMNGASNLLASISPISTQFWTDGNSGVTSVVASALVLTNGAATAGYSDYTMACTVGNTYIVRSAYVLGTSSSATLSIIDPTDASVLATDTVAASATVELEFTATQTSMTFRLANVSTTSGHTSSITTLTQIDKSQGDKIGIKQDDNTRHWTNIVEVLSATQVVLNVGMVSAAASGAQVFVYSSIIDRPQRCYNYRTETIGSNNEIPVQPFSRQEYMQQPNKGSTGTVVSAYYSPLLTNGKMYVWQTAQDCNQVLYFTFDRPLQTATLASTPDVPEEWYDALKWNIAKELIAEYRVPAERAQVIIFNAEQTLDQALDYDEENQSVNVQPSFGG